MKKLTEKFFVAGHPVGHSLSPVIHSVFFEHFGMKEKYGTKDILPEEFKNEVEIFKKSGVVGFNVTIPHKNSAFEVSDVVDDYTKMVGAVNTVEFKQGKVYGYNTDGIGFIKALEKNGISVKGKTVCILGAGGAVNSIAVKTHLEGGKIIILARRKEQADAICKKQGFGSSDYIENINKYTFDILVNATPVGMHPNEGTSPIEEIKECEFVYDLIYNPGRTEFLRRATEKGIKCDNGLWMLVYQAAASFEIWTGKALDESAIDEAYKRVLLTLEGKK